MTFLEAGMWPAEEPFGSHDDFWAAVEADRETFNAAVKAGVEWRQAQAKWGTYLNLYVTQVINEVNEGA